jgi:chemotaxis protein MotB
MPPPKTEEAAAAPPPLRPIYVIKRKKAGHGGHHGGAWKVAYADFVTAMMALFIVLWLMSADEKVKEAISAFFNNPTGPGTQTGSAAAGAGNSIQLTKDDMAKLKEKMEQALKSMPNFRDMKEHVEMTITADGLRIELLETEAGMFFESGRPLPSASGAELLARLAEELGRLPNNLLIEGHTDAKPFAVAGGTYSNWELSTDRANAARRLMEGHGVRVNQVAQVRGFAERQLRHPQDPESAANRRISVIVQYLAGPTEAGKAPAEAAKGEAAKGEAGKAPAEAGKDEAGKAPAEAGKAPAAAGKAPEAGKAAPEASKKPAH